MKRIITTALLTICIGIIGALDLESYEFIDYLMSLPGPRSPVIMQDSVIFFASSSYRRVGISFAHEGFSKVHWMRKLVVPKDLAGISDKERAKMNPMDLFEDSGILFHVQVIPEGIANMDYRMVIDGLWTGDPLNPQGVSGIGGICNSRVALPTQYRPIPSPPQGVMRFTFTAPPGEKITVGGSFNNWDPFMYELKETGTGNYSLTLQLPPGTYQYVFFYRGERYTDPYNPYRVFTNDGKAVSQTVIQ